MLSVLVTALALVQSEGPRLNPAFIKTPEQFTKVWAKGEKDSKKKSNLNNTLNRMRRTIGTYRRSVLGDSEGTSFVYYIPPEILPYVDAFNSAHEYAPAEKVDELKAKAIPTSAQRFDTVYFYTTITLMPQFAGGYGRISRYANPDDLKDVKVVLRVGKNKILQPIGGHPGNLLQSSGSATSAYELPQYTYSKTNSSASGSAYGSGGYAYGTATGTSTTVTTYHEYHEEGYDWYHGEFFVGFKIIDKDGKPLITDKDKDMTLLVIYGNSERQAKYKLSDLMNPYR